MAELDEQDQRIAAVFKSDEVPEVDDETLQMYCEYLKPKLDNSCELTGIEKDPLKLLLGGHYKS